jgi:PAS domain S-box-containing protein
VRQAKELSKKPLAKAKFEAPLEGTPKTIRLPSSRMLYLAIALVTVVFLVAGYLFYHFREQQMRQRVESELSITAQLKAGEIAHWREERLLDADMLRRSPFFIEGVEKFMASPSDTEAKDKVLARLAGIGESYPYQNILLVGVNGNVLLNLNYSVYRLSDMALSQLAVAFEEHKTVMTDFHYPPDSNSPQMDVIAPLFSWGADSQPAIGAVVLCIDPAQYLYPLLQSQPVPSETGETLLVERDGDQVLFLNELRFQKDTALKLRIPLSQQEIPAVMAVLGEEGVVEGRDYRGVGVLAALKHIPDSSWYLVAKMDVSEALSAWRLQAGIIIAFVAVLLAAALTVIGLIWQRRQRLVYQSLYQTEMEAQALRSRFEYLVKYANDIVLLVDDDHHIVEANDRALQSYGYRRNEMIGLPLAALIPPGGFSSYRERLRKIQEGATVAEAVHQRKDGSTFPVEVSARVIEIEGKPYFQEIIRDITERKRADEELMSSKARYKELADSITDVFFAMDRDLRYTYWNKASEELTGIAAEDALGKHLYDVFPETEETKAAEKEYVQVLETGKPRSFVNEYTLNGKKRWFDINAYPTAAGVSVFVRDITERNWMEKALVDEAVRRRVLFDNARDGIVVLDEDARVVDANRRFAEMLGYTLEEVRELHTWDWALQAGREELLERGRGFDEAGALFETCHRRKDGTVYDVEVSVNAAVVGGQKLLFCVCREITERKKAEETLAEEVTRRRILMEQSRDGISILDEDSKLLEANQRFLEMLGYTPEEVREFHTWDWDTQWTREELLEMGHNVDEAGVHLETRHRRKDGTVFDVELSVNSVVVGGQKLLFCVSRDISERRRAEETLRQSENKYRMLVDNASDAIIVAQDDRVKFFNDKALEISGYSREEIDSVSFWSLIHPIDMQKAAERYLEGLSDGAVTQFYDLRFIHKTGDLRWVDVAVAPITWEGKPAAMAFVSDVTERKLAGEAIRRSEQNFRDSIENSPLGMHVIDKDGKHLYTNRALLDIWGYSSVEELEAVPREQRYTPRSYKEHIERLAKRSRGEPAPTTYEISIVRSDGQIRHLSVSHGELLWNGEKQFQLVYQDITERKQVQEALRRSEENYRDSIEKSPLGIRILDADGEKTLYANRAVLDMWGYSSLEELEAVPIEQRYTPEGYAMHMEELENRIREGFVPLSRAISIVRSDGEVRTLLASHGELLWNGEKRFQVVYQDITERKRAEEMLNASKERYRLLADNVKDAIWLMDLDLNFLWFSPSCERLRGYTVEEMKALPLDKHVTPESLQRAWDLFVKAMEDEKQGNLDPKRFYGGEFEFCRKDGSTFWAEAKMSFMRNEKGEATAMLFEGRDITERRRAEEALRQSEEKYRTVLEEIEEGYYEIDLGGNWTFFNDAFCNSLGYSREELTGMNYRAVTFERDADALFKIYGEAYRTGEAAKDLSFRAVRKDGSVRLIEASAFPMRNEGGNIIGFRGLGRDVTERKKAEEALRLSEQNFRDSMERSPLGIRILAKEGAKTVFANKAFLDMWGYSSIEELEVVPKEQRYTSESYAEQVERLEKRRRGKVAPLDYEISIVRGDGQVRYLSVSRGELFWGGEKVFQLVYQDITELKQATHELEKAVEELQLSNAELERFAYVASHDLQEPLRMVSSYTQLLGRRYKDKLDADANDFINYAVGGAERMQELLNDLLIYSRVGTRGKPFKRTDMEVVLEAALDNLQVTVKESKARVTHDPLPTVMADEGQMVQLLQNLIGNSVKFRGKGPPHIHVSAEPKNSKWVFTVKDNGIGIESQYFDRIFLIFQRLHRDEYPGTGTGLAIAKKIVERHGGRIWVESQPGEGSTFYFSIKTTGERQKTKGERQKAKGKRQKAKGVRQHARGVKR